MAGFCSDYLYRIPLQVCAFTMFNARGTKKYHFPKTDIPERMRFPTAENLGQLLQPDLTPSPNMPQPFAAGVVHRCIRTYPRLDKQPGSNARLQHQLADRRAHQWGIWPPNRRRLDCNRILDNCRAPVWAVWRPRWLLFCI